VENEFENLLQDLVAGDTKNILKVLLIIAKTHPDILENAMKNASPKKALLKTTLNHVLDFYEAKKSILAIKTLREPLPTPNLSDPNRRIVLSLAEAKQISDALFKYVTEFNKAFAHLDQTTEENDGA